MRTVPPYSEFYLQQFWSPAASCILKLLLSAGIWWKYGQVMWKSVINNVKKIFPGEVREN